MLSDNYIIEGSKGGEKEAHTPVETPNNLLSVAYAKVLIAVAEGELEGNPTGKDIYLNGTPLISENGNSNFGGVTWEWRKGSVDQTHIPGIPEVSNEINVGVELKQVSPWVQQVTKEALSAVRVTLQWSALMQQLSNGDTVGHTIDYAIDLSTNGGPFTLYQQYQVSGKTNGVYERTHRVNLPESDNGWSVRVRRITPNATGSLIQDTMNIKSYAEVVDAKQRYPNTALLFVQFDSRLFGGGAIPKISVKTKGRVVRVPSNYDPASRTYSGTWSGDFKWAWTDNPAWVFFDIVTQDRFGLGSRVTVNQVDKWALYEVAQYCDVMVDDGTGSGGLQPRHTCNIYIQSKADAWEVLRDICSIFNGMMYWNGNQFVAKADKLEPVDDIPTFSRSNVVDGEFQYSSSDERTIFTSALVSYDEPTDHYETQVEAVREDSQILRWGGDRQTTMAAIGCTSRAEAQRKGKYTLITNLLNRGVTFKTGLQGLNENVAPGSIIGIADPLISGKPFTGRLIASTPTVVTLDRLTEAKAGDLLFVNLKDGSQQARTIRQVSGRVVTVTTAYSESLPANAVWYLEAGDLKSQLFKVVKVTSPDESIYEINAVEYNTSKYAAIDNGARLEPRPISKVPPSVQKSPSPITITSSFFLEQTMAVPTLTVSWPTTENAVLYEGEWRIGQGDWVTLGTTGATEFTVRGIYSGKYLARVRAINALGIKSLWGLSETTEIAGKAGAPPAITSLTVKPIVYGMILNWTFPNGAEDTARTEVMYSVNPSFAEATKLGDFAYPQQVHEINGLAAGVTRFFWARLVDRSGNVGPYFPMTSQNGIMGQSSTDVLEYEKYFLGQIKDSALGQELSERIELIDGPSTLPGSVNQRVEEAQTNLEQQIVDSNTQLQEQIDAIADLAGSMPYDSTKTYTIGQAVLGADNKLYQAKQSVPVSTPPPNATYWTDIGQAVITADGLAARVTTVETTVTNQGNAITAQSTRIDGVQASLDGKADATAVNTLTTRVTNVEGTVSSQGTAITGLNSSLATTNGNVTAAQNAANAANTLAGGKGEVIYGSTTPAVAKRLAQNLWIDTTGGANTPKRWNGSDWVAVTDKVATDAATAAANALAQVATKANASAVNSLTTRVTDAEGNITAQGNAITTLTTTVAGKANQSAVDSLTTTVTQQGNSITSQGNAITALTGRVTSTEGTVLGQGTAINSLDTKVTNIDGVITATSNRLDSLTSSYRADDGEGDLADALKGWDSTASFSQEVRVRAAENMATVTRLATLDAQVGNNAASISTLETVIATDREATASRLDLLKVGVDANTVSISTEATARADGDSALGTRIEITEAKVGDNTAALAVEASVRSSADSALSQQITTVQTSLGTTKSSVQTVSKAVTDLEGKAKAMWAVKLNVNAQGQYVAAGIGLGIENGPAGLQSTFLVQADKFAVVNGVDNSLSAPFVVQGGQVFIKDAFIANGSITMLKIGDSLQSDNYVAGTTGWRLLKSGLFEINGQVAGQGRMTMTNRSLRVYDGNNVKRVQLGDLSE